MGCNGICGTCAWHENFNGTTDWICSNEDSDSYGADMKEFLYTDSIIEDALEERYGEE